MTDTPADAAATAGLLDTPDYAALCAALPCTRECKPIKATNVQWTPHQPHCPAYHRGAVVRALGLRVPGDPAPPPPPPVPADARGLVDEAVERLRKLPSCRTEEPDHDVGHMVCRGCLKAELLRAHLTRAPKETSDGE